MYELAEPTGETRAVLRLGKWLVEHEYRIRSYDRNGLQQVRWEFR